MFSSQSKSMARIVLFVAFLSAATVVIGCGQDPANTGSQEDPLKKLQELSREGNEEDTKTSETRPAGQEEKNQQKQQ